MDPISTIIEFAGRPATIVLAAKTPKYDPRSSTPFVPGGPLSLPLIAGYEKNKEVGPDQTSVARVMFTPMPFTGAYAAYSFAFDGRVTRVMNGVLEVGQLVADQTRFQILGLDYVVKEIRPRFFTNELNGFTLSLVN